MGLCQLRVILVSYRSPISACYSRIHRRLLFTTGNVANCSHWRFWYGSASASGSVSQRYGSDNRIRIRIRTKMSWIRNTGFMYKLYRHKLYREQIVSAQIVSAQFVSAQFVSDTNCIGHKLYRAQIVSCNKLYRGTNCIRQKLLITKFLITKFLSNKVPKLQNS